MATLPLPGSVIIVGGSLAGLMHALVFLSVPSPPKIRILERSPTELLHNQGAGIVAGQETQAFFSKYVDSTKEIAVISSLRHYLNREGHVIPGSVEHREQRMTSWDLVYHLLRWKADGMESGYAKGLRNDVESRVTYENGCIVTNVEEIDKGVKVSWKNTNDEEETDVADMVIAADGASSTIRRLQLPEIKRNYAGYVAWRGTVPENELSEAAKSVFIEKFTFYHAQGIQSLGYLIPGGEGSMIPGERLFNWVWYCNYEEGSDDLEELMTDVQGRRHHITLPVGGMWPEVWEKQKIYAAKVLPPQFAEAVSKTKQPFIQAITDVISPVNSFVDGKFLLVGDALAGFRPHTAASTGQAAFDALQLGRYLSGEISKAEYDDSLLQFAISVQRSGVVMGDRSQFGQHHFAE